VTTELTLHEKVTFGEITRRQRSRLLEATINTDRSDNRSLTVGFSECFNGDISETEAALR
jgi:hypothetical protein